MFSANGMAQLDIHKIKMKFYPYFILYIKTKSRWTINLNVKGKGIGF